MFIFEKQQRKKIRTITIHKENILREINQKSFKLAEAAVEPGSAQDAVASDSEDTLDGPILASIMDGKDADIRRMISFCLAPDQDDEDLDDTPSVDGEYVYMLMVPEDLDPSVLKAEMKYIHDYLVEGTLMGWYRHVGSKMADSMEEDVKKLAANVEYTMRTPFVVKAPSIAYIPSGKIR